MKQEQKMPIAAEVARFLFTVSKVVYIARYPTVERKYLVCRIFAIGSTSAYHFHMQDLELCVAGYNAEVPM